MTDKKSKVDSQPIELPGVLADELKHINGIISSGKDLDNVFKSLHEANLAALCFSGGGIRSATFGLGIVQALAKYGLLSKFDYVSTVSGGGYLGSWLSAWAYRAAREDAKGDSTVVPADLGISRVQDRINCRIEEENGTNGFAKDKSPNPEAPELRHLREYSNYMSPKTGLLSADTWTLVAIYIRNLFLNLTIFVPLIAAVLILPRFLFHLLMPPAGVDIRPLSTLSMRFLGFALAAGAIAITFVVLSLPSRRGRKKGASTDNGQAVAFNTPEKPFLQSDAGVLLAGVLPLLLSAFLAAMLWAWNYRMTGGISDDLGLGRSIGIVFFLAIAVVAYAFGTLAYFLLNGTRGFHLWGSVATIISSLVGGSLLWLVSQKIFDRGRMEWLGSWIPGFEWQIFLCFSVPLFLIIVLAAATLFVGLSSKIMTDEDREWLARYGAWVMIAGSVWVLLNALVLIGPSMISLLFRNLDPARDLWTAVAPTVVSIVGVVSGVVSLIGGFSGESKVRDEPVQSRTSRILAFAPQIASVIFLGFILIGLASVATLLIYVLGFSDSWSHIHVLNESSSLELAIVFGALALAGFVMACFVNVNKFSLHGAYRDRLVRAYLGASNRRRDQITFTGFDDSDNLELHQLAGQRPLHVINATANLVGGDNLAWQNRKAASFTMSPLHCGSWAVGGYRASKEYCVSRSTRKALRLGTAMAISGAAANPNMGYFSSPVVTFLMSLFNIRLGWWLGNTGKRGSNWDWLSRQHFYQKTGPSIAVLPLINETFGRTDEHKRFLMVTDGGHFENLALYEMVLRRCRLIVLSDGAADADFKFGEIANAIQKCKVDLGVDIQFLGSLNIRGRYSREEGEVKKSRFAIAKITYPEKKDSGEPYVGWLLYTRPTYYGKTEPRDVQYYADSNHGFPHQSTGDQMYDEKQFEAYRGLGFLTMMEIRSIFDATSKGDPEDQVDDELEDLFGTETDMRNTLFGFFNLPDPEAFKTRAAKRER